MPFIGNKSAGAIFGTFLCRFHISTTLSELNVPLQPPMTCNIQFFPLVLCAESLRYLSKHEVKITRKTARKILLHC